MRKADNLTTFCAVVMKSGNLNFLEPSGPLQACNGTALPFTFTIIYRWILVRMRNVSEKKFVKKIKRTFYVNNVKKYSRARQSTDGSIIHPMTDALCMPDN